MSSIRDWSTTAADNDDADSSINWTEGQTAASVNNSARAMMAAIAVWRDAMGGAKTSAGSSNAYTLTTGLSLATYANGLLLAMEASFTNTGAATIAIDGLSAKDLKTPAGAALSAGAITSGGIYLLAYETGADIVQVLNAGSVTTRASLGLATTDSPEFLAVNIGDAADTTVSRASAGDIAVEGNRIFRVGGVDVPIADGGTGASTATAAFDALAPTTTRGDIIFRDASNNVRLAKGTSGQVLQMGANDPAWATLSTGWTLIASGGLPSANLLEFTSITARHLLLKVSNASCATATRYLQLQFSIDNGSSYLSSAVGFYVAAGVIADLPVASNVFPTSTTEGAAGSSSAVVQITTQGGLAAGWFSGTTPANRVFQVMSGSSSSVNAIRLIWNSTGNFDAGTYELYGI